MPKKPIESKVKNALINAVKKTQTKSKKASKKSRDPQYTAVKITPQDLAFLLESKTGGSSHLTTGDPISDFFLNTIPQKIKKIDVFTEPVSERWGAKRLGELCSQDFCEVQFKDKAFLFFNKKRNLARVYWNQGDGAQLLERGLFNGTFLFPAATSDNPWVQIPKKSLPRVLKTESSSKKASTKS